MNTVLLIDDEYPARQLLKRMIDWEQAGFTIAWEAEDGLSALELYEKHHPDLVITDIQMPVMDGLELLSAIRRQNAKQPFIVFSCHESFSYARKVIQLGGLDYLLKDTLSPELLYTALENAKEHLCLRPSAQGSSGGAQRPEQEEIDRIWESIVTCGEVTAAAVTQLRRALPPEAGEFFLFCLHVSGGILPEEAWRQALSLLTDQCAAVGACRWRKEQLVLAFPPVAMKGDFKPQLLHRFKAVLDQCAVRATLGASSTANNLEDIGAKLREAQHAVRYSVFLGEERILYFDPIMDMTYYVQRKQLLAQLSTVRGCMESADREPLERNLRLLYGQELSGMQRYHYLLYLNRKLWELYQQTVDDGHGAPPMELTLEDINALDSAEGMCAAYTRLLTSLQQRDESESYSRRVRDIIHYINLHYSENISLDSIAEVFEIHKTHLARLFKTETGLSLNEFIRRYRIETAKSLLRDSRYRVNEVAYHVGFRNTQSFYNGFMHYEGITPKAYRDRYG